MAHKVLQLCHKPPFPSTDGGCLEMAKMSRYFDQCENYDLVNFSIYTDKHPFNLKSFEDNFKNSSYHVVYANTKLNPVNAGIKLIENKSYHLSRFKSSTVKKELIKVLVNNSFDYIFFESIFVAQFAPIIKKYSKAKLILNSPNIEFEIWERLAANCNKPFRKNYLKKLAKQLKIEEHSIYQKMDGIIAITHKDLAYYQKYFPDISSTSIPFLLDLKDYPVEEYKKSDTLKLYHIGSMDWQPNLEGVKWFLNHVWDNRFSEFKEVSFSFAGKNMPKEMFSYNNNTNIEVRGFVKDAKEYIQYHDVMVVPLKAGSGLRVKILEGMALGKTIISTKVGAEGINYTDNKNILIAHNEQDFINHIKSLIRNPDKIKLIGSNARKLIEEEYSSVLLKKQIPNFLSSIV